MLYHSELASLWSGRHIYQTQLSFRTIKRSCINWRRGSPSCSPEKADALAFVVQPYWTPFWQLAVGALGLAVFAVAYAEPGIARPSGSAQRDPHTAQRSAQVRRAACVGPPPSVTLHPPPMS